MFMMIVKRGVFGFYDMILEVWGVWRKVDGVGKSVRFFSVGGVIFTP